MALHSALCILNSAFHRPLRPEQLPISSMSASLLQVHDLHVHFRTDDGLVRAVNGVSFDLNAGQTLGIVGESGSGKTVTNLALLGLIPQPPGVIAGGRALFRGQDLLRLSTAELSRVRGRQ